MSSNDALEILKKWQIAATSVSLKYIEPFGGWAVSRVKIEFVGEDKVLVQLEGSSQAEVLTVSTLNGSVSGDKAFIEITCSEGKNVALEGPRP